MTQKTNIAEQLGRLFEVGFNIGILAYIDRYAISHHFADKYRQDLQHLQLRKIAKRIVQDSKLIELKNIDIVQQWSRFFIQKGFLAGLNFFREYLHSMGLQEKQLKRLEILYYQCCFSRENSIGTYSKDERKEYEALLSQFGEINHRDRIINQYAKKGEFLRSDTLMLLRYRQQFPILCVDLSIFSVKSAEDILALDNVEVMRQLLMSELSYLRSKSVFSKLRIDTGTTPELGVDFSKDLRQYFTAFKRQDKESTKLIQAASYAHSFYNFLQENARLPADASVVFNVVGYSDRNVSSIALHPENLDVLATCATIYKNEPPQSEIHRARQQVLQQIQRSAARSFNDGKTLVNALSEKPLAEKGDRITQVVHQECIADFFNSLGTISPELAAQLQIPPGLTLRNAHAELIKKSLVSSDTYLFLTGNPGIGKTTAIANFLQAHTDEGFLFFYVSPRKQVNLDIIEKFKSPQTGQFSDDRLFSLTTNSVIIQDNNGRPTLHYQSNQRQNNFTANTLQFINAANVNPANMHQNSTRLQQITEDSFRDRGQRCAGVMKTICEGIHTAIADNLSNTIIATVSIQSLRVTPNGRNTLDHLTNIFKSAYNSRDNRVIPAKIRQISQRIKHIFIMVDEITGDDSGASFLSGIDKWLHQYQLTDPQHGFNTKVIVADASIVDPEVIHQHLSETSPEPDKIYFRLAKQPAASLSMQPFQFKQKQKLGARVINANSYPARSLQVTYKVFFQCVKFKPTLFQAKEKPLIQAVQRKITEDILGLLDNPAAGQLLVYVQDKRRLQELIETIRDRRQQFDPDVHYLEIHANLSEAEKRKIQYYKQEVQVVFMTSSASRGLSFPKAKHILVEIPRFQIERNLMEVIQVIYRARGEYWEDGNVKTLDNEDKFLCFYLCDRAIYYPKTLEMSEDNYAQERKISLQESILSMLNILLILKISIMTRIWGAGRLGRKDCLMIPIGGKSVSAAGTTFTGQMTNLIRELKNEYRRKPSHKILRDVFSSLQGILETAEFLLIQEKKASENQCVSYLSLRKDFQREFANFGGSLDRLLAFGNLEAGHLTGNLLVVPIKQRLEEIYEIRLEQQIKRYANRQLLEKMNKISRSPQYAENLRSGIRDGAMELVKLLEGQCDRTQWFEQYSENSDRYYALPLFALVKPNVLSEYFKTNPHEEEDREFRTLLSRYVYSLYPSYDILPIGRKYREFPFLIFRSYSLAQLREKMFTDKYLLNSSELNVLNLILSKNSGD